MMVMRMMTNSAVAWSRDQNHAVVLIVNPFVGPWFADGRDGQSHPVLSR